MDTNHEKPSQIFNVAKAGVISLVGVSALLQPLCVKDCVIEPPNSRFPDMVIGTSDTSMLPTQQGLEYATVSISGAVSSTASIQKPTTYRVTTKLI